MKYKRRNFLIKKQFQIKYTLSVVVMILLVMLVSGVGVYMGIWSSIVENFSSFKVSQNLENVKRLTDYERARYRSGDFRLEKIFREAELLSLQDKDALKKALKSVNRSLVPKIAVLMVVIFIGGIIVFHKIAGPLYRFEKTAGAISEGDLRTDFHIRKDDALHETASSLNSMVNSLHRDVEDLKKVNAGLKTELEVFARTCKGEEAEKIKILIAKLDGILSRYKT